jgi:uncharacterized protein with ParB-like and HNH nuclease domain
MSKLHVDQQSVKKILSENKSKYLIPEYQRPYEWGEDKCRTLWEDILDFAIPDNNPDNFNSNDEYFLGSIVTFKNDDEKCLEVIDGQQRITTLLLLLRAIYTKLDRAEDDGAKNIKSQIESCLWYIDEITAKPDKDKIRIDTKVATDKDRTSFVNILKTGKNDSKNIYSINYNFFQEWINDFIERFPTYFYKFCVRILNNCILLPIECESQEIALRIFTTLNDRGMPLADSDIFKAQLYKYYNNEGKQDEFIKQWQELSEICDDLPKSKFNPIDETFTQYLYWLRAKENIKDTTVPGLRKYFEQNKYEKLKNIQVTKDVIALANFWRILSDKDIDNQLGISTDALKYIHCLEYMPNAFWKYNLTVFFFANKDEKGSMPSKEFENFVKKTLAFCFVSFVVRPTVSDIKNISIPALVEVAKKGNFVHTNSRLTKETFTQQFHNIYSQSKTMIKPLLLWEAYQIPEQEIIEKKFKLEIEHILPKNWKSGSYKEWNKADADDFLEKIGNKILLDKKTNIQAGDVFFKKKKEDYYTKSPLKVIGKLVSDFPHDDWIKSDIETRENKLLNDFIQFAEQYGIFS